MEIKKKFTKKIQKYGKEMRENQRKWEDVEREIKKSESTKKALMEKVVKLQTQLNEMIKEHKSNGVELHKINYQKNKNNNVIAQEQKMIDHHKAQINRRMEYIRFGNGNNVRNQEVLNFMH